MGRHADRLLTLLVIVAIAFTALTVVAYVHTERAADAAPVAMLTPAITAASHLPQPRPTITAPRNHTHMTITDSGVQPMCPMREVGWHVTFRLAGTHVHFPATCDRDGRVAVWDAR